MAIREGYTIEGKKAEDLVALARRRSENARISAVNMQKAAEYAHEDAIRNPVVTLSQPKQGYGPRTGGSRGPLKVPKVVHDSIREKGKEVLKEMGVDEADLK